MTAYEQAAFDVRRLRKGLFRFLSENGDGTGNTNANGDYSITPMRFFIKPPEDKIFIIRRLLYGIVDNGSIGVDGWGNGPSLTNGVRALVRDGDDNESIDFLDGDTIKTNGDWAFLADEVAHYTFGSGDELFKVRFEIVASGQPLVLRGERGESLSFEFSDDVSNIIRCGFVAQGGSTDWRL